MNYWPQTPDENTSLRQEATKILLCGGFAGVITWASVFPLDVVKTRLQTQHAPYSSSGPTQGLLALRPAGAWRVAKDAYREGGMRVFFRGLGVCSIRAFIVNGVQWAAYEWIMHELGQGRAQRAAASTERLQEMAT
jgi:solute carrier family 25 carnitine/acylcarnitine transporter 20/29